MLAAKIIFGLVIFLLVMNTFCWLAVSIDLLINSKKRFFLRPK